MQTDWEDTQLAGPRLHGAPTTIVVRYVVSVAPLPDGSSIRFDVDARR
jgi:hypothetical protein